MWTHKYSCGLVLLVIGSAFVGHAKAIESLETPGAEAVAAGGLETVQAAPGELQQFQVLFQPIVPFPPGYTPTAEPTASEALEEESVVGPAVAEDLSQATVADAEAAAVTPSAVSCPNCMPYEMTTAYNKFPWQAPVARALMFTVNKLSPAPTVPSAWSGRTLWPYKAVGGYLIAVQYNNTPVGPYSELLYAVGNFTPSACSTPPRSSVVRMWVDLPATLDAGRRIWGMPKQLATFAWRQTSTTLGVTVRDSTTNLVIFDVTATFFSKDLPAQPSSIATVHFPINDNAVRNVSGKVSAYSVSEKAFQEKKSVSATVEIPTKGGYISTRTSGTVINNNLLTGRSSPALTLGTLGVMINKTGFVANWSISQPALC